MSQTGGGQTTQCFWQQCARRTQSVGAGGLAVGVELQVQVPLPLQWGYREYMYRRPAFNLLCWQPDEWCSPQTPHFQYNISKLPMRSTSRSQGSPAEVYPATAGASQFAVPFPVKPWDFSKFQSRSCGKSRGTPAGHSCSRSRAKPYFRVDGY